MPVAIIGAVAAAGIGAATGATLFGLSVFETFLARIAISLVLTELSSFLSPKPKSPDLGSFGSRAQNRTQQVVQAITSRKLLYGECLSSGPILYATSTESNLYLHVVIALASQESQGIDEIWLGQDVIPNDYLDAGGNVVTGKYAGYVRIKKHLGGDGQTADTDLVSEVTEWDATHKLNGITYLYIRYKKNQTLFPSGVPNAAAITRGRKIFDSRIGANRWTPNATLFVYDYLQDNKYGANVDLTLISATDTQASANSSEEIVTTAAIVVTAASIDTATDIITLSSTTSPTLPLQRGDRVQATTTVTLPTGISAATNYFIIPYQFQGTPRVKLAASLDDAIDGIAINITSAGSGVMTLTKNGEPRYFGGGVLDTAATLGNNLKELLTASAGRIVNTGGTWKIFAGVWRTAAGVSLSETDLRAPLQVTTRTSRASRFNTINGVYVSPANNWQPANYPQVQNATYLTADMGDVLPITQDLPYTQRSSTAQRVVTIMLNRGRQEIMLQYPAKLTGIQFEPLDNVPINNVRMGWVNKLFEVQTFKLVVDVAASQLGCDLVFQETTSVDYDWDSAGEVSVDPAPNTNLPDAFTVPQITGFGVSSISIGTLGGDKVYRATGMWDVIQNAFVANGGWVHLQYRLNGTTTWNRLPPIPGDATQADIFSGALSTGYDVQVWLENQLGIIGPVYELDNLSLGSSGGVGTTIDWGSVADAVGTTNDWGSVADPVGVTNDWGGVA